MFTSRAPNFGSAYASWLRGFDFRVFFRKTSEMKWLTSLLVDADPMILQEHREQHSMRDPHCVKACHVAVATAATHRGIRAGHYDQLGKSMTQYEGENLRCKVHVSGFQVWHRTQASGPRPSHRDRSETISAPVVVPSQRCSLRSSSFPRILRCASTQSHQLTATSSFKPAEPSWAGRPYTP